ncbi:unnamed protein product [Nesidiocoris tenuis]|uniref:Uncharacterized protein n=1 Tax=Nesidiocoris tenuis TaxID=355587 RepID=A0A6H5FZG9_9HEMI|nr:unnamed protein product [Nesidiocoris tenuis]CAA9994682.1 unnamed protein product [Nesidiocoris tenuis]
MPTDERPRTDSKLLPRLALGDPQESPAPACRPAASRPRRPVRLSRRPVRPSFLG